MGKTSIDPGNGSVKSPALTRHVGASATGVERVRHLDAPALRAVPELGDRILDRGRDLAGQPGLPEQPGVPDPLAAVGQTTGLGDARVAVRRPAGRCGSPWSDAPEAITVPAKAASTGRANTQARAVAPSSVLQSAADLVDHLGPDTGQVLPRRRCRRRCRSRACRRGPGVRQRPGRAGRTRSAGPASPSCSGWPSGWEPAGERSSSTPPSSPSSRAAAGRPGPGPSPGRNARKGDGPTIPACAQP